MKKLLYLLLSVVIVCASSYSSNVYGQDVKPKKLTKEEKKAAREAERKESIMSMLESKNFSFMVRSIDAKSSPQMAYMELKGSYMIKVTPQEFTAYLPLIGGSAGRGNSPGGDGLNFGTNDYIITIGKTPGTGGTITIKATDPKSGFIYTFNIYIDNNQETLTVSVASLQDITFIGYMRAGHKSK